jgi:hypothetical protein
MGRRAIQALVVVAAAAIGIAVLVTVFAARDDATVSPSSGPGVARPADATALVSGGNVALLYSDERLTRRLRALADDIAGPADPSLVAAGQAIIVRRRANLGGVPVIAVSATHRLDASGPDDPALRGFIEYWLGRVPAR